MKKNTLLFGILALAASPLFAAESDDVKGAVKKLADASGYSWTSTVKNGNDRAAGGAAGAGAGRFQQGPTEGKAIKDGTTLLSMSRGDTTTEAVLKGDKGAIKTAAGWQSLAEANQPPAGGAAGGRRGGGAFLGRMLQSFKGPVAQAEDLLAKVKSVKKADDAYTGELTEEGVKQLLTFGRGGRGGGNAPAPTDAKGSVKFWIKDGVLSKYELNVQGTMTFNNNDVNINRTTTVEIKDVGKTKVEVPEEAKKKLS